MMTQSNNGGSLIPGAINPLFCLKLKKGNKTKNFVAEIVVINNSSILPFGNKGL